MPVKSTAMDRTASSAFGMVLELVSSQKGTEDVQPIQPIPIQPKEKKNEKIHR
jgi:hypothetical protein